MMLYLDIETTYDHKTIWCCVIKEGDDFSVFTTSDGLQEVIDKADYIVGHNIIGFDAPVLQDVWGVYIPHEKLLDTLVLSRLTLPERKSHSLGEWGIDLGYEKIAYDDHDSPLSPEKLDYCKRDVEVLERLHNRLNYYVKDFSKNCVLLEHKVASIIRQQEISGFKLDEDRTKNLLDTLEKDRQKIEEEMLIRFPPIITERGFHKTTKKKLKDHVEVFNINSRQQIHKRLTDLGAKFTKFTDKGNPIVDEETLRKIDMPEAWKIAQHFMLNKRTTQIQSWLDAMGEDKRVHGRVIPCGTVTGRMAHLAPNLAQVPSLKSRYGKECRECWTVEEGNVLVGADASGLELRMLAHYLNDAEYTKELLEGDIHAANQAKAGLETRDQAKTFIYALLYGAGSTKIGKIVGGTARDGTRLIENFMREMPSLAKVRRRLQADIEKGFIIALDGRKIKLRSAHSALNTCLQSAGAIVMKQALVFLDEALKEQYLPYRFVANIHDEWQIECPESVGDTIGQEAVKAIRKVEHHFSLNCPLDGEYKIGKNWAETH